MQSPWPSNLPSSSFPSGHISDLPDVHPWSYGELRDAGYVSGKDPPTCYETNETPVLHLHTYKSIELD